MSNPAKIFTWAIRVLLGILFILSGFVKAEDILGFSYKLNEYWRVFGTDFMEPTSLFLAWFISVFEMALGVAMIVGYRMKLTAWPLVLMMVFFTFLTGYSAVTGSVTDCGCFGDAIKLTPCESFIKDLILMVLVAPLFYHRKRIAPIHKGWIPFIVTMVSFALFGGFSYHAYQHLPPVDFRPYAVGNDMYAMTIPDEKNDYIPKAHDYEPIGAACDTTDEYSEFHGNVLLIIYNKIEKSPEKAVKYSVDLANQLKDEDIKVFSACSSIDKETEKAKSKYKIPYCIASRDETVMKTIIRSSPGYLVLKDGIILGKWHHNDAPDKEEIMNLLQ